MSQTWSTRHRCPSPLGAWAALSLLLTLIAATPFTRPASGAVAGAYFTPMPEPGRFAAAAHVAMIRRDAIEYDDQYHPSLDRTGMILDTTAYYVQVSYGIWRELAFDLLLGWIAGGEDTSEAAGFDDAPAWGFGVRYGIWHFQGVDVRINAAFQYLCSEPAAGSADQQAWRTRWEDWQLSVDAAKSWDRFTFYAGLRHSDLLNPYTHPSASGTREGGIGAENNTGVFVGLAAELAHDSGVSLELHALDERGVLFGVYHRF